MVFYQITKAKNQKITWGWKRGFLCTDLQENYPVEQKIAEELLSQESQLDSTSAPSY